MIALLVVTDGRDELLDRTIASAKRHIRGPITRGIIHDDCGDGSQARLVYLQRRYPRYEILAASNPRLGFGGAIARAWRHIRGLSGVRFVFHLEDDFLFSRVVDLDAMAEVLDAEPKLAQLALRRQPWNEDEAAAGGIVELHPQAYEDRETNDCPWLAHRLFFTTNPSLYRRDLTMLDWPEEVRSEGIFSHRLMDTDPELRFGFWGARDSGEWVEHIGTARVGSGY